jgi:hypothetical protein
MVMQHKKENNNIFKGFKDTIKELGHDNLDVIDIFVSDILVGICHSAFTPLLVHFFFAKRHQENRLRTLRMGNVSRLARRRYSDAASDPR